MISFSKLQLRRMFDLWNFGDPSVPTPAYRHLRSADFAIPIQSNQETYLAKVRSVMYHMEKVAVEDPSIPIENWDSFCQMSISDRNNIYNLIFQKCFGNNVKVKKSKKKELLSARFFYDIIPKSKKRGHDEIDDDEAI